VRKAAVEEIKTLPLLWYISKFTQVSARKLMATVFWDRKGVLMVEFMQQGTTVLEVYCETLKKTA
jgi:hypothetical protein